ncbi:hypothetical protein G9P44_001608 [Scheffersomyces stipitis]|nr:hypothetical protein G9P44_001608 [Scheffersomyces stipitis]
MSEPLEYIPDSEDDEDCFLDSSNVSPFSLAAGLKSLSPSKRNTIQNRLRTSSKFGDIFSPDEWSDLSQVAKRSTIDRLEREIVEDSEEELSTSQLIPVVNGTSQNPLDIVQLQKSDHEDNNNLQIYLDSRNYETTSNSRRGLRKRNFASTHPYLADQAHYLGLSSIDYLNEVYQEKNHDLEPIVKFLNYNYLQQKAANPRDEKYRSKNFYSILGRQSRTAQNKEQHEIEEEKSRENESDSVEFNYEFPETQPFSYQSQLGYDSFSEYNSDSDDSLDLSRNSRSIIVDDDDEGDQQVEPTYISTVDRYTDRYTNNHINRSRRIKNRVKAHSEESRKGLAIRKHTSRKPVVRSASRNEMINFITEEVVSQEDESILPSTDRELRESIIPKPYRLDSFGILSDSSSDEDIGSISENGSDIFEASPLSKDNTNSDISFEAIDIRDVLTSNAGIDETDFVRESDYVNPMFSGGRSTKSKASSKDHRKKRKLGSGLGSKNSASGRKHIATRTSGQVPRKQRLLSETSFARLPKKSLKVNGRKIDKKKSSRKTLETMDVSQSGKANAKDIFGAQYEFSRTPILATVVIEAESEKRVRNVNYSPNSFNFNKAYLHDDTNFQSNFILSAIDLSKIKALEEGKSYVLGKDSIHFLVMGETFNFNLLNMNNGEMVKYLSFILRLFRQNLYLDKVVADEIYESIKGVLQWSLICQEPPSTSSIKLLNGIFTHLIQVKDFKLAKKCWFWFPYFYLLYYCLHIISNNSGNSNLDALSNKISDLNRDYWLLFFRNFESIEFSSMLVNGKASKGYESFYIMFTSANSPSDMWKSVIAALKVVSTEVDVDITLDALHSLIVCLPSKFYSWSPFYVIYNFISGENDSTIHNKFLDVIQHLNKRFHWPFEERMVLLLYSGITFRRFANFADEMLVSDLIGQIRSRDDIPDNCFFERFMMLLYSYVSELPEQTKTKRLITKFITSSHYHYQPGKEYYAMFMNRANFVLLLRQLSVVDLKNQVFDLISQITSSNDTTILSVALHFLGDYIDICLAKKGTIPFETLVEYANSLLSRYFTLPGVIKLWRRLVKVFEKIISPFSDLTYCLQYLSLLKNINLDKTQKLFKDLFRLVLQCLDRISRTKDYRLIKGLSETLNEIILQNHRMLNVQMGRFPLPTVAEESDTDLDVELGIRVWVRCTSLLPDPNWNQLILQKFPYTGNQYSRDKFSLFLFNEIMKYNSLKSCRDILSTNVLRSLCSFSFSKYLATTINLLHKEKVDIFEVQKGLTIDDITMFHLQNFRHRIVSNAICNISKSFKLNTVSKKNLIGGMVRTLNNEYDKYFSSNWYKDFCVKTIKCIKKECLELCADNTQIPSLASKLGILNSELDLYKLQTLPLTRRLSNLHCELLRTLNFNDCCDSILIRYTHSENVDLLYHLVSIYSRAVANNQTENWKITSILLEFFSIHFKEFKFNIINSSFTRFLKSIAELPKLSSNIIPAHQYFRTRSMITVADIFLYSTILFEGYKDLSNVKSIASCFLNNLSNPITLSNNHLDYAFSPYKLYDLTQSGSAFGVGEISPPEAEVMEDLEVIFHEKLNELSRLSSNYTREIPSVGISSFDFSF